MFGSPPLADSGLGDGDEDVLLVVFGSGAIVDVGLDRHDSQWTGNS